MSSAPTPALALLVLALVAACAVPPRGEGPARPLPPIGPGLQQGDGALSPALAGARPQLEQRLARAHRRLGRGRPAATGVALGELGPGGQQGFSARLLRSRCYVAIAVTSSDDQALDLVLLDPEGLELDQDRALDGAAAVEVCPTAEATFRLVVRASRGSCPFALQVYGP